MTDQLRFYLVAEDASEKEMVEDTQGVSSSIDIDQVLEHLKHSREGTRFIIYPVEGSE